jgi:hypothetical protein
MFMSYRSHFFSLILSFFLLVSFGFAEDYHLQYFLAKASSKPNELSKKERMELLNRMLELVEKVQRIHIKLIQAIQTGEMEIRYQEGKFWMSKLEEDKGSVEIGIQQIKSLKENPNHLVPSIKLYKSLKDLSTNFNAYNNVPSFSAIVGDLAPELELWADPIFYSLYLLPLGQLKDKDVGKETPQRERKLTPKGKKP